MNVLYTAEAHVSGGRQGRARSSDGRVDVAIDPPAELGGPQDGGTNPEQLFALGYGACFLSALSLVARSRKISAKAFTLDTRVNLVADDDGSFAIDAELHATMPGVDDETAEELLRKAHEVCPYSKATRGNIDVRLYAGDRAVEVVGV